MHGHKPDAPAAQVCWLGGLDPHGINKPLCILVSSCPHRASVAERQPAGTSGYVRMQRWHMRFIGVWEAKQRNRSGC